MTDNLRDALEKLVDEAEHYDTCDLTLSPMTNQFGCSCLLSDLRKLLAAHPVEPAPTDEWPDELEPFIEEQMKNPAFRKAYEAEVAQESEPAQKCAGHCYSLTESGAGYIDPKCPKHGG